jgi:hypothetical protein
MPALENCCATGRNAESDTALSGFCEGETPYRLHEDVLLGKYRHWRGHSGRSYAFSVYAPEDCPAYVDAVLIVARRGGREVLACIDLGPFPDAWLFKLRRRYEGRLPELEFQIHVLAERGVDRRALIEDIAPLAV